MMNNVLGAALLGSALAATPAAAATVSDLGLAFDATSGGYTSSVSTYTQFESIFGSIYNFGTGYSALFGAFGSPSGGNAYVYAIDTDKFDGLVTFVGGATKKVTLDFTDYTVTGGPTAAGATFSYAVPAPIAGAGLPLLVGAVAWGARRRVRGEANAA